MKLLHRMQGRPLLLHGRGVFALTSGCQIGTVVRGRVYDPAGRYLGTIDVDCLVYRTEDRTRQAPPFTPAVILLPETLDELEEDLTGL